jgi:hypothetical protein
VPWIAKYLVHVFAHALTVSGEENPLLPGIAMPLRKAVQPFRGVKVWRHGNTDQLDPGLRSKGNTHRLHTPTDSQRFLFITCIEVTNQVK